MKQLQPHQQRVVDEKAALDIKCTALTSFVCTNIFVALNFDEQDRLQRQLTIMRNYSRVLQERITAFINQPSADPVTKSGITNGIAPRVTPEQINALMDRVVFTSSVPDGTTSTFVHAYLDGKFLLATGHSACVSSENFDAQIGIDIATRAAEGMARNKLWELEGYSLYKELNQ